MSETDLDFDPDELAMLRALFRTEAHDALEAVTARVLAGGSARPTGETVTDWRARWMSPLFPRVLATSFKVLALTSALVEMPGVTGFQGTSRIASR